MPPSLYIIRKQISGDCHDDCSDTVKVGRVMMMVKIRVQQWARLIQVMGKVEQRMATVTVRVQGK